MFDFLEVYTNNKHFLNVENFTPTINLTVISIKHPNINNWLGTKYVSYKHYFETVKNWFLTIKFLFFF